MTDTGSDNDLRLNRLNNEVCNLLISYLISLDLVDPELAWIGLAPAAVARLNILFEKKTRAGFSPVGTRLVALLDDRVNTMKAGGMLAHINAPLRFEGHGLPGAAREFEGHRDYVNITYVTVSDSGTVKEHTLKCEGDFTPRHVREEAVQKAYTHIR